VNAVLQDALAVFLLSVGQYLTWRRVGAVERAVHERVDPDSPDP